MENQAPAGVPSQDPDIDGHSGGVFGGMGLLTATDLPEPVLDLLLEHGAHSVGPVLRGRSKFTAGLIADGRPAAETLTAAAFKRLRSLELPVYTTSWADASISRGAPVPLAECRRRARYGARPPLIAYDPRCLAGWQFTTSDLGDVERENIEAAVTFFGGLYSDDLLSSTTHIVVHGFDCRSDKTECAIGRGVTVVDVAWVQAVVENGMPPPVPSSTSDATTGLQPPRTHRATDSAGMLPVARSLANSLCRDHDASDDDDDGDELTAGGRPDDGVSIAPRSGSKFTPQAAIRSSLVSPSDAVTTPQSTGERARAASSSLDGSPASPEFAALEEYHVRDTTAGSSPVFERTPITQLLAASQQTRSGTSRSDELARLRDTRTARMLGWTETPLRQPIVTRSLTSGKVAVARAVAASLAGSPASEVPDADEEGEGTNSPTSTTGAGKKKVRRGKGRGRRAVPSPAAAQVEPQRTTKNRRARRKRGSGAK